MNVFEGKADAKISNGTWQIWMDTLSLQAGSEIMQKALGQAPVGPAYLKKETTGKTMEISIIGAGAMGTLLGHGFCRAGHHVTLIDLPERVHQIRALKKLVVISPDGQESSFTPALVTSKYEEAGIQDAVFLATKSQDLPAVAQKLSCLTNPKTAIITIQNGLPWWYLQGLETDLGTAQIPCLDPDGLLEKHVDSSQVVGCVAYPAATLEKDGRIRHVEGLRFPVGELDGAVRDRTVRLVELFEESGFKSRAIEDIRSELWLKAWGAVSINPISALSRATMVDICDFDETRDVIVQMMREVQHVAEALGANFRHTIEKRVSGARAVGAHKTSMLQDVESGRPLELDALMLSIIQLADMVDIEVPTVKTVYACVALLNQGMIADAAESEGLVA
jgi:2-dehydropantoate 2-reductase